MPQEVCGEGFVPLKRGSRAKIKKLMEPLAGWLEWSRFEFTDDGLDYAYDDIVCIGTAGDLDDFLEAVAAKHATAGWAHYGADDEVWYYGPNERAKLEAQAADLERQLIFTAESLVQAKQRLRALG